MGAIGRLETARPAIRNLEVVASLKQTRSWLLVLRMSSSYPLNFQVTRLNPLAGVRQPRRPSRLPAPLSVSGGYTRSHSTTNHGRPPATCLGVYFWGDWGLLWGVELILRCSEEEARRGTSEQPLPPTK